MAQLALKDYISGIIDETGTPIELASAILVTYCDGSKDLMMGDDIQENINLFTDEEAAFEHGIVSVRLMIDLERVADYVIEISEGILDGIPCDD